jgi:hypothetical protein
VDVVRRELLEALAAEAPQPEDAGASPPPAPGNGANGRPRLKVGEWLQARGRAYRVKPQPDSRGRTVYVLKVCPFDAGHGDPDSCVMQEPNGKMSAQCFHNSCRRRGWQAFKAAIGPPGREHYDPPRARGRGDSLPSGGRDGPTAYELILAHFRRRYQPVFRRGEALYSAALGREVHRRDACVAPSWELVAELLAASNCRRLTDGQPDRESVPGLFRRWAPSAWVDLLAGLPEETETPELVDAAADELRGLVSACLHRQATFARIITDKETGTEVARQEIRSLIGWAELWAKPGPHWQQVRSLLLWCRRDEQNRLRVAMRSDLAANFGPKGLAAMPQRRFGTLAGLYGIGTPTVAGGQRVVALSREFLDWLLQGPGVRDDAAGP